MRSVPPALRRTLPIAAIAGFLVWAPGASRAAFDPLPSHLSDQEFWSLSEMASEANGEFQSDNFLSNERGYQVVIPDLIATAKPGRVYLGVGPEQNYPYIIALKPALAVIFDVRRGNLHEQLLYKSLFEMSSDRVDFLSRLFSRPKPDGLTAKSSIEDIMDAFMRVTPTQERYQANLDAVGGWLTKHHGFALHPDDLAGIDYVYKTAFFNGGPNLVIQHGRPRRTGRWRQRIDLRLAAVARRRPRRKSRLSRERRELERDEGSRDAQPHRARRRRLRRLEGDSRRREVP